MGGFRSARRRAAAALLALSTVTLGVVVATQSDAAAGPNVVRLHLGSDGVRNFSFGTTVQSIVPGKNSCTLTGTQNVMLLSSTPNGSAPGVANDSLGVKITPSSANGTPCGQTDQLERLLLRPGSALGSRTFSGVRLDLEMTGNAVVKLTLASTTNSRSFFLQTGNSITQDQTTGLVTAPPYTVTTNPTDDPDNTDACAAPNSSGPNSNQSDNCLWTVTPGFNFTSIELTTTLGTVALEGSADFGNNPDFDTLFYLSNAAPVATADSYTTLEDTAVTFDVRANDVDGDGDPLTATATSSPTKGALVQNANGSFTYTPNPNDNGSDSFTYLVSDGTNSSTATVTITITPVNDRPVAVNASASTNEDTAVDIIVGTDIDSSVINASCTGVTGGTVTNLGNGSITFTPNANFNGSVSFTCTITDGSGATATANATVNVGVNPVNDAPVAVDDAYDVPEQTTETPFVTLDVVVNDTDVDLDTLTATAVTAPAHGTAEVVAGGIRYTPTAGYRGADSFTYTVSDGTLTDTATVTLLVYPVICSAQTVSDTDGAVSGTFTRLTDPEVCKRYVLQADEATSTVLFVPQGGFDVAYRGTLTAGPQPAPIGTLSLLLRYDPSGGTTFRPVQWCDNAQFDGAGDVTDADVPAGETWCIASETTQAVGIGQLQTLWQVFGVDDPNFLVK